MKITELEDELENLVEDLQIISETVTVVGRAISNGDLKQEETCWTLFGVARNAKKAIADVEKLVIETITIRSNLENLKKEGAKL